jgi:hypothetical protein
MAHLLYGLFHFVPSPLGGMVKHVVPPLQVLFLLLYWSKPTVWDGDMKAIAINLPQKPCSKPTAWDGDIVLPVPTSQARYRSKPTVWDGDTITKSTVKLFSGLSCSKPTGWDRDLSPLMYPSQLPLRSKPTVWDGDIKTQAGFPLS